MSTRYVEPDGGKREQRTTWALGRGRRIGVLDVPEVGEVSAQLADDVVPWGSLDAVQDGPSVGDPLWSWDSAGDVATLGSEDGTTPLVWMELDHGAATITIGSDDVDLTLMDPTVDGVLTLTASTSGGASVIVPPGAAPTGGALVDGAFWLVNATGWFGRRNGVTEQFAVGVIGPTQGGTGLTAVATGDLMYGSAVNTWARLTASATASGPILRQASGIPSWTTATYPNTVTAGRLLAATATNVVGTIAGADTTNQLLIFDGSNPTWVANLPWARMPTGTGTWTATQITLSAAVQLPGVVNVEAGGLLRLSHRSAPASPQNGDIWTTTAGLFVRINGVTVGPLS